MQLSWIRDLLTTLWLHEANGRHNTLQEQYGKHQRLNVHITVDKSQWSMIRRGSNGSWYLHDMLYIVRQRVKILQRSWEKPLVSSQVVTLQNSIFARKTPPIPWISSFFYLHTPNSAAMKGIPPAITEWQVEVNPVLRRVSLERSLATRLSNIRMNVNATRAASGK